MTRLRVNRFTVSLDGYGAGPAQSVELVETRTFHQMSGSTAGTTRVDDAFATRGRRRHDGRPDVPLRGRRSARGAGPGQSGGRRQGRAARRGVATLRAYLQAGLVDEMHVAIAPVLLGRGEHLWGWVDLPALGYARTEHVTTDKATHIMFMRGASRS